jgi:pimeloyl-ACP methyl ester carboxylesterase
MGRTIVTSRYLDGSHLDEIAATLRDRPSLRSAGRWFDGTIGIGCDGARVSVRIDSGQVLHVRRGQGMRGTTFAIDANTAAWDTWVRGRSRDFSRLLYTGALRVSGDRMEFGRSVLLASELLAALRDYYRDRDAGAVDAGAPDGGAPDADQSDKNSAVIRGAYTDVDGLRVFAEECGEGRPVVLLHTAGLDGSQWRYVLPELARRGYRAIAPDLPGHGRSDMPPGGPLRDVPSLADAVGRFCAASGLTRYSVVGCSVGGDITLSLGVRFPDNVAALVACAAADHTPSASRMFLELSQDSAGAAGWNDMFRLNCLACTGDAIPADRLDRLLYAHATANHLLGTADLIAWNGHDIRDTVARIACPALLVHGSYDFFVDREAIIRTADAIPGGEFVELPEIGHYPMVEDTKLGGRIADFLDRSSGPGN